MTYASGIEDVIVDALSSSSLLDICKRPGMPNRSTVERWIIADPAFAARCARARELHADHIVEGHAAIEVGLLNGTIDPAAARVVISSQQWRASKMNQRRYGDKLALDHQGRIAVAKELSDDELTNIAATSGAGVASPAQGQD